MPLHIPSGDTDDKSDPMAGMPLRESDAELIYNAYAKHQERFHESHEPVVSMAFVLLNIGDRYSPVECVEGEWKALRKDVPVRKDPEDPFLCPNGHEIEKTGSGLKLGWIKPVEIVVDADEEEQSGDETEESQENQKG